MLVVRKTTVYLDEELRRALSRTARLEGRSEAEIIREALRARVLAGGPPKPGSIGAGRSGDPDLAGRDEEVLADLISRAPRGRRRR